MEKKIISVTIEEDMNIKAFKMISREKIGVLPGTEQIGCNGMRKRIRKAMNFTTYSFEKIRIIWC